MNISTDSQLLDYAIQQIRAGDHQSIIQTINSKRPLGLDFSDIFHFIRAGQLLNGFHSKRVLELGGALPPAFLFEKFNISNWTSVEYSGYDNNQYDNDYDASSYPGYNYSNLGWEKFYNNWQMVKGEQFDIIYSIAAFEHIYNLPSCLQSAYQMLKPGGLLYSYFTPIWSASNGSHGFHPPELSKFGNHSHLMFNFPALIAYLVNSCSYTPDLATSSAHSLYKDSQLNRYTYEDFISIFNSIPFSKANVNPINKIPFVKLYDNQTLSRIKSFNPAMFDSANGFEILLTK